MKYFVQFEGKSQRISSGGGKTSISLTSNATGTGYYGSISTSPGWCRSTDQLVFIAPGGAKFTIDFKDFYGSVPDKGEYGVLEYRRNYAYFSKEYNQAEAAKKFEEEDKTIKAASKRKMELFISILACSWLFYDLALFSWSTYIGNIENMSNVLYSVLYLGLLIGNPIVIFKRNMWLDLERPVFRIIYLFIDSLVIACAPFLTLGYIHSNVWIPLIVSIISSLISFLPFW